MSEELEKLRHKQYVAERKLTAAKHKEKRLQSELKRLTRSERTHRLCTRAGMLETFLKEPTVLTDEDVMELLTFIFQSEAVHKKLNLLIESRRETQEADEGVPYQIGDKVKIVGNPAQETTRECIAVSYPGFVHDLQVDGDILIDDGDLELRVIEKTDEYLLCEVQNEATLGNRKSVNVPGVRINLPSLTEKDRNNILYAIEKDIDFIAHSFVRNKQDVLDIRQILDAYGSDIKIIAKIENQEGVDNIDEILEVADGVMVARGDLGIEVPQERIPGIQRLLIKKCILVIP